MQGKYSDRRQPRIMSLNLVNFTHFDVNDVADCEDMARTKDLSEGGIMLECNQKFEINTRMDVQVAMHETLIMAKGKITKVEPIPNSKKFEIGIKFTDISDANKRLIQRFLNEEIL